MTFQEMLDSRGRTLIEKWRDEIFSSYPAYSRGFMQKQKNQFANPVGSAIESSSQKIFELVCGDCNPDDFTEALDKIVQIRSVQDFTPSQAIGFLLFLKKVVREECLETIIEEGLLADLLSFESKIDLLMLHATDIYVKYKEKVFEIRTNEAIRRVQMLLERVNVPPENGKNKRIKIASTTGSNRKGGNGE